MNTFKERKQAIDLDRAIKRCTHFTGIQHNVCAAGVRYGSFPAGIPCLSGHAASCEHHHLPTREAAIEQLEERNRQMEEASRRTTAVMQAIEAAGGCEKGSSGSIPCPNCVGTVRFSRARSNGHWMVGCSTSGCVAFMQ